MAIAQVAGIVAGGYLVWFRLVLPSLSRQSPASLIAEVLFYVAVAWICGGLVTYCVFIVVALADLPDAIRLSLRSSAPAMWFAPAIILLSVPAAAAFAVSLVLIINATRLLVAQWVTIETPVPLAEPVRESAGVLFGGIGIEPGFFTRRSVSVLMCALSAQAAFVALLWHYPLLAAAGLATSAAIFTSLAILAGAYRSERAPGMPPSVLSVLATFLLAAVLSLGGVAVERGGSGGSGPPGPDSGGRPSAIVTKTVAPPDEGTDSGGGFPGVILLPEIASRAMLLVPAPIQPRTDGAVFSHPVGIPFSGEYWMFKPPRSRPPLRSVIRRGRPSVVSFHTTDGAPMEMEAHQKLDSPIDLRCCRKIQVSITDTNPDKVSLELILIGGERTERMSESLGRAVADGTNSFSQTLSFPIRRDMPMRKFDEFKIVFHQDNQRSDKSARVAIERFVLAP